LTQRIAQLLFTDAELLCSMLEIRWWRTQGSA
jgi:hypothetical protein